MNANIENMVAEYAKANKINKAKLMAFVEEIVSIAGIKQKKESNGKRGKPASEETLAFILSREFLYTTHNRNENAEQKRDDLPTSLQSC